MSFILNGLTTTRPAANLETPNPNREKFSAQAMDKSGTGAAINNFSLKEGVPGQFPAKVFIRSGTKNTGTGTRYNGMLQLSAVLIDDADASVLPSAYNHFTIGWDFASKQVFQAPYQMNAAFGFIYNLLVCAGDGVTHATFADQTLYGLLDNIRYSSVELPLI